MSNNELIHIFAADSAGTKAGTFAEHSSKAAGFGLVGLVVPSTSSGRPCGQDVLERRLDSAQLLLCRLFGGATRLQSFSLPGRGSWFNESSQLVESERVWLVISFCNGLTVDDDRYVKLLRAAVNLRILWRQSVIGVIGPSGYVEV